MTPAAPTSVVSYLEFSLGLSFTGPRRERLLATVDAQRSAAGLTPEAFLERISRPGQAWDRLVAAVTVGETSFFRDAAQCDLLRELVLPSLREGCTPGHRLTAWSAGCASGEEAFTLAALADEAGLGDRFLVVGSDASARALEKARRARYGSWSLRSTSAERRSSHFRHQDGQWQVSDRLRQRIRFLQRNLLDGPPPPASFDLVLCRNVLIYLTLEAVQQAAAVLASALTPSGWLITAAGDPPLEAPGLEKVRTDLGLAYRRVGSGATSGPSAARTPARPPATTVSRRAPSPAARRTHRPRASAVPPPVTSTRSTAEQILALGNAGRLEEACRAATAAVEAHPLDVELWHLKAVLLLESGRQEEAAEAASAAVYLGPLLPATHLLLGQVEHARGNTARARRSFRNGSRLLATAQDEAPVALAGDLPAAHLTAVAERYLSRPTERP